MGKDWQPGQIGLSVHIKAKDGKVLAYQLGEPVSVGRRIEFLPQFKSVNAFHLPLIKTKTFELKGQFVGDVERGGSCNVESLIYIPHGLTHIETAAHILKKSSFPPMVSDLSQISLNGLALLIDLTHLSDKPGSLIHWPDIRDKISKNSLPLSMLAIKTKASILPVDYDFSGKNYLALTPQAAQGICDHDQKIRCLILDLPSIDPEKDEGKLLAHRAYFGLPLSGYEADIVIHKALVELAYFGSLKEGYYYVVITPPPIQTNAVSTGLTFWPLENI